MKVTIDASDFDDNGYCDKLDEIIREAIEEMREDPGGDGAEIELVIRNDFVPDEDEEESEDESSEDETPSKEL